MCPGVSRMCARACHTHARVCTRVTHAAGTGASWQTADTRWPDQKLINRTGLLTMAGPGRSRQLHSLERKKLVRVSSAISQIACARA